MARKTRLVTIPERIREARLRKTMTAAELAKESGVSRTTIHHYENDEHSAAVRTVRALAAALDVEPGEIVRMG